MKKILFMTDFARTLTPEGLSTQKEYEINVKSLIDSLIQIKSLNRGDSIIFSISTNISNYSYLETFLNILKKLICNMKDFEIGKIFLRDTIIQNIDDKIENPYINKEDQLINYILELKSHNTELVWIGFADDRHAEDIDMSLKSSDLNVSYNTFQPGTNNQGTSTMLTSKQIGIIGLNQTLNLYLEKRNY